MRKFSSESANLKFTSAALTVARTQVGCWTVFFIIIVVVVVVVVVPAACL